MTTASELISNASKEYPPSNTTARQLWIFLSPYVIQAYPIGLTEIPPSGSPLAESNPADIIIISGSNFLIIGNKN